MVALSLDTATGICAVAISDPYTGNTLSSISNDIGRGHAEILMEYIDKCLDDCGHKYKDISQVISTTGPGSFTGVRVGLSCARAIALALSVPVIGVSNLQACAIYARQNSISNNTRVSVVLDARRGEVYFQSFDDGAPYCGARVTTIDKLVNDYDEIFDGHEILCGNGVAALMSQLGKSEIKTEYEISHSLTTAPIEVVAEIGLKSTPDSKRPLPLYLRNPDAKSQLGFAVPRS